MINKIRYAMSSSEEDMKKIIYCGDLDKKSMTQSIREN